MFIWVTNTFKPHRLHKDSTVSIRQQLRCKQTLKRFKGFHFLTARGLLVHLMS